MTIEHATRTDHRQAALRNAPSWVRRRLGVERSGAAPADGDNLVVAVWERGADGRVRQLMGPPGPPPAKGAAAGRGRPGGGTGVSWDSRSPHRPGALTTRVWLVAAHGDALAHHIRSGRPETISRAAFGTADQLNREGLVPLVGLGHRGFTLGRIGRSIVAHDTSVGLVLQWQPDMASTLHREVVEKIERGGAGCSVSFSRKPSDARQLPGVDMVTRAHLAHIAIVEKPAYRGAIALVCRGSHSGDEREIEEQLARVVREAEFKAQRAWNRE